MRPFDLAALISSNATSGALGREKGISRQESMVKTALLRTQGRFRRRPFYGMATTRPSGLFPSGRQYVRGATTGPWLEDTKSLSTRLALLTVPNP